MAWLYFPTKDTTWLLAELEKAYSEQASGGVVVSAAAGDVSYSKSIQVSLDQRIERLKHDLAVQDPTNYAPSNYIAITRTKIAL